MNDIIKLEPCFCKSKTIKRSEKTECYGHGEYIKEFKVYCHHCGSNVRTSEYDGGTMIRTIKKWNTRQLAGDKK